MGLLDKIMKQSRPDAGNTDSNFKDDVYREQRGLLGKIIGRISPKQEVGPNRRDV